MIALSLMCLFLAQTPPQTRTMRAVIVGIDRYDAPSSADGGTPSREWTSLDGAVNDARAVRDALKSRYGFIDANITFLSDEKATREAIRAALKKLAADSRKGDLAFVYFAGHGSQQPNSLSDEWDKKDETLVPADWHRGSADVRDKELAADLNAIIDAGADLTAVFDSCHSGSNTRGVGKSRAMAASKVDALDPTRLVEDAKACKGLEHCLVAPESRGAVIISASQDNELSKEATDDEGKKHGFFTLAFLRAIADGPNASVEKLFARVSARMLAGSGQHPELRGPADRRARTLTGAAADVTGRYPLVVSAVNEKKVSLQGGTAMGLAAGCELRNRAKTSVLKIDVVKGLASSEATLVSGPAPAVGEELIVKTWTAGAFTPLFVYAPKAVSQATWQKLAKQATAFGKAASIKLVADPTEEPVDAVLTWEDTVWVLSAQTRKVERLGAELKAEEIVARLALPQTPALAVLMPPVEGMALDGWTEKGNAVQRATDLLTADYVLAGAVREGGRAAFALLSVPSFGTSEPLPLPRRTDWLEEAGRTRLNDMLTSRSWMLARIKGWLTLEQPGTSGFPLDLVVELTGGGAPVPQPDGSAVVGIGQKLRVLLRPREEQADQKEWFVYLVTIDSEGRSTELFPAGRDNNRVPSGSQDYVLLPEVTVQEPAGLDHLVLLATEEKLASTAMLTTEPVKTTTEMAKSRGAKSSDLGGLLEGVGVRGLTTTPGGWQVKRGSLRTVRPWVATEAIGKPVAAKSRGALPNEGPEINLLKPAKTSEMKVPAEIELQFKPRQAPVDLSTFKVELLSIVDFDITRQVREASTLTVDGLRSVTAQPGTFRLRVSLADALGKRTAVEYDVRATKAQ